MTTLLAKWVWVERVMVLLANIGVNLGIATTTQESTVAAGGVIGAFVFVQIVVAGVSHWKTLSATIRADVVAILSHLIDTTPATLESDVAKHSIDTTPATLESDTANVVPIDAAEAAKAAGKAITP